MTLRPHRLAWLPPLLVGVCVAVMAEVAVGMLLYAGPGFTRSLTTLLALESAAFALGLWSAPAVTADFLERLRRRWLLCLLAFLAAALFATAWTIIEGLGQGPLGQGLGLALLAGLPLYAAGNVLGGIGAEARDDPAEGRSAPGAAASLGAAIGFVVTGLLLPRAPMPASLIVVCLVMLSTGGMIYGHVLSARLQVRVLGRNLSGDGEVRVEDRRLSVAQLHARYLIEDERVRRAVALGGEAEVPWDVAVTRALMPDAASGWRVLVVGGGASDVPRSVLREHPLGDVDVFERTPAVVEAGREYFDTGLSVGTAPRVSVAVGAVDDLVHDAHGPYDLVLVEPRGLGTTGVLPRRTRARLLELVGPLGVLACGPGARVDGAGGAAAVGRVDRASGVDGPDAAAAEVHLNGKRSRAFRRMRAGRDEVVVLTYPDGAPPAPMVIEGFTPVREAAPET